MDSTLRLLVVDDFPTMRRILKNYLRDMGYDQVAEAEDGRTAWAMLQQGNTDFLVTDWNMPGMNGLELLQQVRADARLAQLPVLLVTAEAKREQIVAAAQAGVNGYIVKPFTADTLKDKIHRILADAAVAAP